MNSLQGWHTPTPQSFKVSLMELEELMCGSGQHSTHPAGPHSNSSRPSRLCVPVSWYLSQATALSLPLSTFYRCVRNRDEKMKRASGPAGRRRKELEGINHVASKGTCQVFYWKAAFFS